MSTDEIEKILMSDDSYELDNEVKREDWLSSGSTLLNLAASGTPYGCFCKGKYFWIVGDSSSGKTFVTLTCFAEASINRNFDHYRFIFDNAEDGALMDVEKFFGQRLAKRLQPPKVDEEGEPIYSSTIEEFYYNLDDLLKEVPKKGPFIYLLDSMDALGTDYSESKFKQKKKAYEDEDKAKGDYGDGKAKFNSTQLRPVIAKLRESGSILIILSQTRDKIGATMFDSEKQTVAGGRALKFYATFQMWTSVATKHYRNVNGINREIGIQTKVQIKKNRLTGKEWPVEIPIYWSVGIDDIGAMVDFLIMEKHWGGKKKDEDEDDSEPAEGGALNRKRPAENAKVSAPEFDFSGTKSKLIRHIEEKNLELDLRTLVVEVWRRIEDACTVERKNKYR